MVQKPWLNVQRSILKSMHLSVRKWIIERCFWLISGLGMVVNAEDITVSTKNPNIPVSHTPMYTQFLRLITKPHVFYQLLGSQCYLDSRNLLIFGRYQYARWLWRLQRLVFCSHDWHVFWPVKLAIKRPGIDGDVCGMCRCRIFLSNGNDYHNDKW